MTEERPVPWAEGPWRHDLRKQDILFLDQLKHGWKVLGYHEWRREGATEPPLWVPVPDIKGECSEKTVSPLEPKTRGERFRLESAIEKDLEVLALFSADGHHIHQWVGAPVDASHAERGGAADWATSSLTPLRDRSIVLRLTAEGGLELQLLSEQTLPLSKMVPILEHLGLPIQSEQSHALPHATLHRYTLEQPYKGPLPLPLLQTRLQEGLEQILLGQIEDDGFNRLMMAAGLPIREIQVIRAYAKYFWQTGFSLPQDRIEQTLVQYPAISQTLMTYFLNKFDPQLDTLARQSKLQTLQQNLEVLLESVQNASEDRILRRFMAGIEATLRTNYFQQKPHLSFKLDGSKVPDLPLPRPFREIFVYSAEMEGLHLRGAPIARGGIRWSDRPDDFRTEILGLMKTQQVKNAIIIPMGAKGGFIVKRGTGISCYETLIRGLLDLTDNWTPQGIEAPPQVVSYDDPDPYLVVAADKGTASFSDVANQLAAGYGFWLGDAFASGGTAGYDHKKMAITSRGAWESAKHHFLSMGKDLAEPFTMVGIGDMAGDVFGNGLLRSNRCKLLAAFNHAHIFIDPNPDPLQSFSERQRLFHLAHSTWADYDPKLFSKGGGVYSRSSKIIHLSREAQEALQVTRADWTPSELIQAILRAPVDLLWNGGIGTFVKAQSETHAMVGDKSNDALRINATDLRTRVIVEGGNLGLTQLARVEYAQHGGRLNTDAIDNSGGVNCSDYEVNLKILLNALSKSGQMTLPERNALLLDLTDEVRERVIQNNRIQNEAISMAAFYAAESLSLQSDLMEELERNGKLDRTLECLPSPQAIQARKANRQGLTRPEIAVLMAYAKNALKNELSHSDLSEDPFFKSVLEAYFPERLNQQWGSLLEQHYLKKEIIATQLANGLVNEMGISFVYRLAQETGSSSQDIVKAYHVARTLLHFPELRQQIHDLNHTPATTFSLLQEINRLLHRWTRWFLCHRRIQTVQSEIDYFLPPVKTLMQYLFECPLPEIQSLQETYEKWGIPTHFAFIMASITPLNSGLEIVEAACCHEADLRRFAELYFGVGQALELTWFREQIKLKLVADGWEALARAAFRDDLDRIQRDLTASILRTACPHPETALQNLTEWLERQATLLRRWRYFISKVKAHPSPDFTMFSVILRELSELAQRSLEN